GFDAKVNVVRRDRLLQSQPFRVRIQAKIIIQLFLNGLDHLRGGAERVFVGVQLQQVGHFWLFARQVWLQLADQWAPVLAHDSCTPNWCGNNKWVAWFYARRLGTGLPATHSCTQVKQPVLRTRPQSLIRYSA